jgi:cobalt-zinc-cadmium efflux system outer membrane protein
MRKMLWRCSAVFLLLAVSVPVWAQQVLSWEQVRDRFQRENPTLLAGQFNISESRAEEITANLRPNPGFSLSADGTQIAPYHGVWQPLAGTDVVTSLSYLIERDRKRALRLESARKATDIAVLNQADLERTLVYDLRNAFVQTLQAKAVYGVAQENLKYYDHVLDLSREQFKAGGIARVDLDRLELQRVQYESDLQSAIVNLRTAKIQLLTLLNDRTPIEQFDVTGPFDFSEQIMSLDDCRSMALATRPDLKAAVQTVEKAKSDHRLAAANGSTDPTLSAWWTYNPSFNNPNDHETLGVSVSIPLRIFDRNQGEKLRTQLDIDRNQRLLDATQAQVFSDVDSAYATLSSNLTLLKPYKETYLKQAVSVRETITFSYQHGGASLLDFLSAENDYRTVQLSYVNLVGAYLGAASQLNLAVGHEVIP